MSIFEFSDYKAFLRAWIAARPKKGRGEIRKMADALGINPAMISQALSGDKVLSLESAAELAEHLGLTEKETDYLLLLVEYERAGSHKLRKRFKARIEETQKQAARLAQRMKQDQAISPETLAVYYSSWTYTGIRNLTAVDGFNDIESIAGRLQIPKPVVARVVEFLLEHGLCRTENGKLTYGPGWTHIGNDSPLAPRQLQNWRVRAFTKMEDPSEENLFFASPMSLSHEAAKKVRQMLPTVLENIQAIVRPSPSETVRCLNVDWFEY